MLPIIYRVDKKTIDEIFKRGKTINSPLFSFKFIKENHNTKISFIVPKSLSKNAVRRNKMRRTGYSAIKNLKIAPGIRGVFIYKKEENELPEIKNSIKGIIDRLY